MSLDDSSVFNSELYSGPESSPDPYAASSDQTRNSIDISGLPGTKFGRIFRRNYESKLEAVIQKRLARVANEIHRPLQPDEIVALAFHTSKGVFTTSLAGPTGVLCGMYRTYSTRKNFNFPFLGSMKSENGWFNGERIRFMGGEIAGPQARVLVHGFRLAWYSLFGAILGKLFVNSFARTVIAVGEAKDPGLANVIQELRDLKMGEIKAKIDKVMQDREFSGKGAQGVVDLLKEIWPKRSEYENPVEPNDSSPTAEDLEAERFADPKSQVPTNNGQPTPQRPKQPPPPRRPTPNPPFPSPSQPPQSEPYDLASSTPTDDTNPSTGSAWERIRREAGSSSAPPRERGRMMGRRQARDEDGSGEEYAFSREDDSRGDEYAFSREDDNRGEGRGGDYKEVNSEAQREFDERVERERRGGEFDDGGVGGNGGDGDSAVGGGPGWRRERKKRALWKSLFFFSSSLSLSFSISWRKK